MSYFITDFNVSDENAVALEDSIMLKGKPATAGSKMLNNFIPLINATVVERLHSHGIPVAGKTTMDEFGISGLTGDNPNAALGAVGVVADETVPYSLCNDVFGQYRRQAAELGCCYIHPTYGTVSRYGLIQSVSSMDQIGIVCKDLCGGFRLLSYIAGKDAKDGAMYYEKKYDYLSTDKKITVGIPNQIIKMADNRTQESIGSFTEKFNTININLLYFDVYKTVMYILSCAEISNNINRYDGIKYGYRASGCKSLSDLYVKTRMEGFGRDTKLAAVLGAMVLSEGQYCKYYEKAMKIRRLIKESLTFNEYDIIALPCKISNNPYDNLSLYALANLAGLPSVTFSYNGQGIQLIANAKNENLLLTASGSLNSFPAIKKRV